MVYIAYYIVVCLNFLLPLQTWNHRGNKHHNNAIKTIQGWHELAFLTSNALCHPVAYLLYLWQRQIDGNKNNVLIFKSEVCLMAANLLLYFVCDLIEEYICMGKDILWVGFNE